MSFASKHQKGGIQWGVDTKDMEYFERENLLDINGPDHIYLVKGLFINKNKPEKQLKEYGPSIVAILEDKLVNLPNHMLEEVESILEDEEDVADIKAGKVGFKIRKYESHNKDCYGIDWIDIQ